jgi:hypothetical protein
MRLSHAKTLAVMMSLIGGLWSSPSAFSNDNDTITIDFDHFETTKVPGGFVPELSGQGTKIVWEIREEPSARSGTKVLAQTSSEDVNFRFPLLLYDKLLAKDVAVTVQFKPVSGQIDQASGIVVRFQDANHFYVARANALKDEVALFKVMDGTHYLLAKATIPVATGEWHMLKLAAQGTHFQVFFDSQPLLTAEDSTYEYRGKVGLATKSDGVTIFDNLEISTYDVP